jgi:hypothetical protein
MIAAVPVRLSFLSGDIISQAGQNGQQVQSVLKNAFINCRK